MVQFCQIGWTFPCETSTPCMVCQEELKHTVTKQDSRFMSKFLPQAKLLRRSIDLSPNPTKQQFGSSRRCTHFFSSKGIRNQGSKVSSAFPGGTSTINEKWVLWTLEWMYESLRNTIHWERNPSMGEKRATLPKFFLAFCFKGWDSEYRQKLQEWKPDTVQKLSGSVSDHRCLCMTAAPLQSACNNPSKRPSKNQAFFW